MAEMLYYSGDLHVGVEEERGDWLIVKKKLVGLRANRLQSALFEVIVQSETPYLIFFDNMDRISPSHQAFMETLLNIAVVCTTVVQMKENFMFTMFKIFSIGTDNRDLYLYFSALGFVAYLVFRVFRAFFIFRPQKYP